MKAQSTTELDNMKNNLINEVNKLQKIKSKIYANVNIESPMSNEERELNNKIAAIWSQINSIVILKRNLK